MTFVKTGYAGDVTAVEGLTAAGLNGVLAGEHAVLLSSRLSVAFVIARSYLQSELHFTHMPDCVQLVPCMRTEPTADKKGSDGWPKRHKTH